MSDQSTVEGQAAEDTQEQNAEQESTRAGGNEAVLADLAQERDRRQAVEAELEEFRRASMSEQERALDEARSQARNEALSEVNERLVRASIREQAAGRFNDPADALAYLNLGDFQVNDNGDVDPDKIKTALDGLLTSKPYLAAEVRRSTGHVGQGPQGSTVAGEDDMNARIRRQAGRS